MPRNPNEDDDNPCLKEQELSFKCLSKNNYDKEACEVFFVNYNTCKKFWNKIRSDRRAKGISPILPTRAERETIKAEFIKSQKK